MEPMRLGAVRPLGELGARCTKLAARLEDDIYRPESIYRADQNGWPGDWEGRTILGVTMLARATGKTPAYLAEIIDSLPGALNARGYLKAIYPQGVFDEQQMAGHSWLLRGLTEYYDDTGDERAAQMAQTIVRNLYLPARGHFAEYPVSPEERQAAGEYSGSIAGKRGAWRFSTDTGAVFIALDGLTAVQKRWPDAALAALIDEMIEKFQTLDLVAMRAQTHATLSAVRGILRMYAGSHRETLLALAQHIFARYEECGMTANYANQNWFTRPEWTEPCAIFDSFLVAMQLYCHTGQAHYARLANRIYGNAICHAQRENGGFGCDSCVGADGSGILKTSPYEAYWCCTMRGGEGLASVAQYAALTEQNALILPYPMGILLDTEWNGEWICLEERCPENGRVLLRGWGNPPADGHVRLLLPEAVRQVTVNGVWVPVTEGSVVCAFPAAGEMTEIRYDAAFQIEDVGGGLFRLWAGERMLACPVETDADAPLSGRVTEENGTYALDGKPLRDLTGTWRQSRSETETMRLQVLFGHVER